MAEQITLTTPIVKPQETTAILRVVSLYLDVGKSYFSLVVRSDQGQIIQISREGQIAMDLMKILNKSNNTVKSMEKRALEWFQSQPEGSTYQGSITGLPD